MMIRSLTYAAAIALLIAACNPVEDAETPEGKETAISGTAEILCDAQIYELMQPVKRLYDSVHPKAKVTLKPVTAYDAANDLIDHTARGIVIARDWLPEEDSIIKADEGEDGFPTTEIAKDALVFFVGPDFPLDTMNSEDIKTWMAGGIVDKAVYPQLDGRPTFVVPGSQSSTYTNLRIVVNGGTEPSEGVVTSLPTTDSIKRLVQSSNDFIGVGYLSQFVGDTTVKMLRLSYLDSDGGYERPKPVHAAYLIQGKYPFPVPIYIVLRDRANNYNLPSGFMLYVARDGKAQRTFFDAGIEPGYARIELVLPE